MQQYYPNCWNINSLLVQSKKEFLINRTNNPIERYNKRIKNCFSSPHPSMAEFVQVLKNEANYFNDNKMERIKKKQSNQKSTKM
jgi:hypothetical protein